MNRSYLNTLPALGLAALLGACAPGEMENAVAKEIAANAPDAVSVPQEIVVQTHDYAFVAPDTIRSGPTTFRLVNHGPDFHHIQLVRLEGGRTLQDLVDHMAAGGPPPAWTVDVGGPNTPGRPGEETNATIDLKPGNYAMLCVIPAADGQPHIMKGMMKSLTVVPATAARRPAMPKADLVMTLDDYSFDTDKPITAGKHTIRVENRAAQPHEVVVLKLAPGKTVMDFLAFMEKPEGTPPGKVIGGTTGIAHGGVNQITLQLEPGEYGLLCLIPDAKDGKPHLAHGMVKQFTVS